MKLRTIFGNLRPILLLKLAFILLGFKLSSILFEYNDYIQNARLEQSEIVFFGEANGDPFQADFSSCIDFGLDQTFVSHPPTSYKNELRAFHSKLQAQFKRLNIIPHAHAQMLTILQLTNVWHQSLDEEAISIA